VKKASTPSQRKNSILIVDDHPIVRKGLSQLIDREPDLAVCGEAENAQGAMECLRTTTPDLAIVDISLGGVDGIELIKRIKSRYPDLPVLVVSMHDESLFAERALRVGARGYIMKQEAIEKVLEAVRRVLRGELYVSERVSENIVRKFIHGKAEPVNSPIEVLSDRELEVFQLIGQGLGTRRIAEELRLSVKTVESYRANIKDKLKLRDAVELMKHAVQWVEAK
jgi:DNA-binding NarL/FixJ family response regulator